MAKKTLEHLALIMDGNGRWATQRSLPRTAGHLAGLKSLRKVILGCIEEDIKYLSVYCFSTENWNRPAAEVNYLMALFTNKVHGEVKWMQENGVRLTLTGNRSRLPEKGLELLDRTIEETKDNKVLTLNLCVNYGGYDEITRAVNELIAEGVREVTPELIRSKFDNPDIPAPDMIGRSAGELRLSNFLLWDSAYAEFGFYDKLWPDWDEEMVRQVKADYYSRTRKFGGLA